MSGTQHHVKIGRLALAMAMRGVVAARELFQKNEVEFRAENESEEDTVTRGLALQYYLDNSWRYVRPNGGQGRGNNMRLHREAMKRKNIRARSSKRA